MSTSTSPRATALRYGLIGALITIVFGLILHLLGASRSTWSSIVGIAIWIGILVIGIRAYKNQTLGGYMTFGQGFGAGALITVIISVISLVWTFIFLSFIAPDVMAETIDGVVEQWENAGMSDTDIERNLNGPMSFFFSPLGASLSSGVGSIIIGIIISAIAAAILKKDKPAHLAHEETLDSV